MPKYLEMLDSSTAVVRAVASVLKKEHYNSRDILPPGIKYLAKLVSLLGKNAAIKSLEFSINFNATSLKYVDKVDKEEIATWFTSLYSSPKKYDAIIIGAPNGGAAHLCSILDAPFLTEHSLMAFKDRTEADDIVTYQRHGQEIARQILNKNRDIFIINHYDPIHDRILIKYINHIRIKFKSLPQAYKEFIKSKLKPEGKIILIDCTYPWYQYIISENLFFQVGGLGGIKDNEFIEGNEKIEEFRRKEKSKFKGGWRLDFPLEVYPESEWGTMPEFKDDVHNFAREHGYEVINIKADHPEKFSLLASKMHFLASEKENKKPKYIFFDCFSYLDPIANLQSRLIPVWLPFNCYDSYSYAQKFLHDLEGNFDFLLTLVPSFTSDFDYVPLIKWTEEIEKYGNLYLIGVNSKKYPLDIMSFFKFSQDIKIFCEKNEDNIKIRLSIEDVKDIAQREGMIV